MFLPLRHRARRATGPARNRCKRAIARNGARRITPITTAEFPTFRTPLRFHAVQNKHQDRADQDTYQLVLKYWEDSAGVEHEHRRVQRHVEDARRQREPSLLESPEGSHRARDPHVEAAVLWDGRGEFADHEGGRDSPEDGYDQQHDHAAQVARVADELFQSERSAGNDEECRSNQRKRGQLAGGDNTYMRNGGQAVCRGRAHRRWANS